MPLRLVPRKLDFLLIQVSRCASPPNIGSNPPEPNEMASEFNELWKTYFKDNSDKPNDTINFLSLLCANISIGDHILGSILSGGAFVVRIRRDTSFT